MSQTSLDELREHSEVRIDPDEWYVGGFLKPVQSTEEETAVSFMRDNGKPLYFDTSGDFALITKPISEGWGEYSGEELIEIVESELRNES